MKSIKFVSAVAMAAGILAAGGAQAQAIGGGAIDFGGSVIDATCPIRGGAGTDGGDSSFNVALEPVSIGALRKAGDTANHKAFNITIGGPNDGVCENGKLARISFVASGSFIDPDSGTLRNVQAVDFGGAANTNIQVTDGDGKPINLADPQSGVNSPEIANNTTTIRLGARYYATGAARGGLVKTRVMYNVNYN